MPRSGRVQMVWDWSNTVRDISLDGARVRITGTRRRRTDYEWRDDGAHTSHERAGVAFAPQARSRRSTSSRRMPTVADRRASASLRPRARRGGLPHVRAPVVRSRRAARARRDRCRRGASSRFASRCESRRCTFAPPMRRIPGSTTSIPTSTATACSSILERRVARARGVARDSRARLRAHARATEHGRARRATRSPRTRARSSAATRSASPIPRAALSKVIAHRRADQRHVAPAASAAAGSSR